MANKSDYKRHGQYSPSHKSKEHQGIAKAAKALKLPREKGQKA